MDRLNDEGDRLKDRSGNSINPSDIVVVHKPEHYGEIGFVVYDCGYLYVCFDGKTFAMLNGKDVEVVETVNRCVWKLHSEINVRDGTVAQYTFPQAKELSL